MASPTARFIPHPRVHETNRIAVAADPAETWFVLRGFDLYSLPWVRTLFTLRGAKGRSATFDEIVAPGNGFRALAEDDARFFVAGAIGKFWRPRIPFVDVAPEDFASFDEPGFARVAWSVEVYPRGDGGSWIVVDVRVDATSDDAWNTFVPYWVAIGRFSRSIRRHVLRDLRRRLGPARSDDLRVLPGDDVIPSPCAVVSDGVTIEAPVTDVWPLVERVQVKEGLVALDTEVQRARVLGSRELIARPDTSEPSYVVTWAFFLEPIGEDATRLIVRVRANLARAALASLARPVLVAMHSVQEATQLRKVKAEAEAAPRW